MSIQRKLSLESDTGSSDGFDQLSYKLPHRTIDTFSEDEARDPNINHFDDDFSTWQLNRFNRKSNLNLRHIFVASFRCAMRNLNPLIFIYIIGATIEMLSVRYRLWYLFITFDAIWSLIKTSISISLISNERWSSRIHLVLSKLGLPTILVQLLLSFFAYKTVIGLIVRSSRVTIIAFVAVISRYALYFLPCFVFEGRSLDFAYAFKFAIRLSFLTVQPLHMVTVFFSSIVLFIIGPITLSISLWTAEIVRPSIFFSICGSGANTMTNLL